MSKKALITGVSGQDGHLLADYLLSLGYEVTGVSRSAPAIQHLAFTAFTESIDSEEFTGLLAEVTFDEVYHLAGMSFVPEVNANPGQAFQTNVVATEQLLRATLENNNDCRVFLASSACVFGAAEVSPQDESTSKRPRDIYGITKEAVCSLGRIWREKGHFVTVGILYNHESRLRNPDFLTKKILLGAQAIKAGAAKELKLGNLETIRDWSYAGDFVKGFHLALAHDLPDEFVFASGQGRTVKDFCKGAFALYDLDWSDWVVSSPEFFRESEPFPMVGNATKAKKILGWEPEMTFPELFQEIAQPPT